MEIDSGNLPDDPATLKSMVTSLLEDRATGERRIRQLQHMLEQLLRARYGPRRERLNENQLFLFAAEILRNQSSDSGQKEEPVSDRPKRQGHGRQRLPKSLKRQRIVFDLTEHEKQCPMCHGQLKRIGEEISERLEYVPASMIVIEEACQKYACQNGCTVVTAEKPMAPIEKGLPGPGLLAHVVVNKYGLNNSIFSLVLPYVVSVFYVLIFRNVIKGLPEEIMQSAEIDGASEPTILFRIVFPLILPTVMAFTIFTAVNFWNSWFSVLMFIRDQTKWTLQYMLRDLYMSPQFTGTTAGGGMTADDPANLHPMNIMFAALICTVAPIIVIYPFLQRYFIHGIIVGAVKG